MHGSATNSRQQGAALAVVLILLVVMTLLALAGSRGTLLQERMSATVYDRSLAFQAAEAALREGEERARAGGTIGIIECRQGAPGTLHPCPQVPTAAQWASATSAITPVTGTATPVYLVEWLADDIVNTSACPTAVDVSEPACSITESRYRVTARSLEAGRATVILQSIYSVP